MRLYRRYWFRFEISDIPTPLNLGCGVTACDYDDALTLLRERVFPGRELPRIVECIEDVDVSTLDRNHVRPNMGVVVYPGVWFPLGYERPR
jgi:hypothetical protein